MIVMLYATGGGHVLLSGDCVVVLDELRFLGHFAFAAARPFCLRECGRVRQESRSGCATHFQDRLGVAGSIYEFSATSCLVFGLRRILNVVRRKRDVVSSSIGQGCLQSARVNKVEATAQDHAVVSIAS